MATDFYGNINAIRARLPQSLLERWEAEDRGEEHEKRLVPKIQDAISSLLKALEVGIVHTVHFSEMSTPRKLLVDHTNRTMFIAVTRECRDCVACCVKIDMVLAAGHTVYRAPQSSFRWIQVGYASIVDLEHLKLVASPFTPIKVDLKEV